jgi:hypothetical protein
MWMLRMPRAEVYMGGMSKGINCLQLRFSEFVTVITFCRLALGDGMLNLGSYNQKSTASSSRSTTHQSAAEAELGEELRRMKELVQQLLQSNQQMQHEYETMQYTMMQAIISTSAICQILIIVETEDLVINE